ncbi:MAG: cadherin-like domain-containing protein, partial [Candidatus Rokubacteria bacterium]|nr:cadherin-like domain-containing protein [Candidatus Rokubacteria bacterium]
AADDGVSFPGTGPRAAQGISALDGATHQHFSVMEDSTATGSTRRLVVLHPQAGTLIANPALAHPFASLEFDSAPVANGQSVTTPEDTAKAITLTGSDPEGGPLTFSISTPPANGSLTAISGITCAAGTCSASITYTPNLNFNGLDSFTFKVNDGTTDSTPATVLIDVTPVNDAPLLAPIGNKTVNEGQFLQFTVSASDVDGDPLTFSATGLPPGATFDPGTKTFSYTPGFDVSTNVANSFFDVVFQVSDGVGGTASETVRITVIDAPESVTQTVGPGQTVTTDTEADGATATDPVETSVTTPTGGTVSIVESPTTTPSPPGFSFLGEQVSITAPAATAINPLVIVFRIDASLVPAGQNQNTIAIFKNGVLVPACTGAPGAASPDPCVSARALLADGDVQITVLTSSASVWNFGVRTLIPVTIDIKPGSFPNSINPRSRGKIPVAILSTAEFNAPAQVDRSSLSFGPTGDERSLAFCNTSAEDVNGDRRLDLVCHFDTQTAAFKAGDTQGILKGRTAEGTRIRGTDSVRIVPAN